MLLKCCVVLLFLGCGNRNNSTIGGKMSGDTRKVKVEFLDNQTYKLVRRTNDKTYGYKEKNPIKVGGVKQLKGPLNEKLYLNALLGPNGEPTQYYRTGSCCVFKTKNGLIDNAGLLDRFKLYWEGCEDTVILYLNMYDEGDLYIPVGLNARTE